MFEFIFTVLVYYGIFELGRYSQRNNLTLDKVKQIIVAVKNDILSKQ